MDPPRLESVSLLLLISPLYVLDVALFAFDLLDDLVSTFCSTPFIFVSCLVFPDTFSLLGDASLPPTAEESDPPFLLPYDFELDSDPLPVLPLFQLFQPPPLFQTVGQLFQLFQLFQPQGRFQLFQLFQPHGFPIELYIHGSFHDAQLFPHLFQRFHLLNEIKGEPINILTLALLPQEFQRLFGQKGSLVQNGS